LHEIPLEASLVPIFLYHSPMPPAMEMNFCRRPVPAKGAPREFIAAWSQPGSGYPVATLSLLPPYHPKIFYGILKIERICV
jgi:hypothetical protein